MRSHISIIQSTLKTLELNDLKVTLVFDVFKNRFNEGQVGIRTLCKSMDTDKGNMLCF